MRARTSRVHPMMEQMMNPMSLVFMEQLQPFLISSLIFVYSDSYYFSKNLNLLLDLD